MAEATEKQVEVVEMEDGRKVEFSGKRQAIKSSEWAHDHVKIRIDFRDGQVGHYTVPHNLIHEAACHGAEQKYGDSYAGAKEIGDMILACEAVQKNLDAGNWSARVEGSGIAGTSVLARALVEATGKSMETIKQFLSTKTQGDKLALRNSGRLKPIIERLEAEKVQKASKVDTEALLAELA